MISSGLQNNVALGSSKKKAQNVPEAADKGEQGKRGLKNAQTNANPLPFRALSLDSSLARVGHSNDALTSEESLSEKREKIANWAELASFDLA